MSIYAVIENYKVINTLILKDSLLNFIDHKEIVKISDSDLLLPGMPGIGWDYKDGQFQDNRSKGFIDWYAGETEEGI